MKKLVALLLAVPRLAWADESVYFESTAVAPSPAVEPVVAPVAPVAPEVDSAPASSATPEDSAPEASSQPSPLSYGAEVDVASRYVLRGLVWSKYPVLQPSARVSEYGATLGVAGSAYMGSEPGIDYSFSELDLSGRYDLTLGAATISPTVGAYLYPHSTSTAEVGATVTYDLSVVALMTHQFIDVIDNAGGYFADVGVARGQPLGSRVRLDAAASLAWCSGSYGRYYIEDTISGMHWNAAQLDSSLTFTATPALYFRLHGTASRMLETHLRHLGPEENIFSGGVAMGVAK
jgi:hypothetical protein